MRKMTTLAWELKIKRIPKNGALGAVYPLRYLESIYSKKQCSVNGTKDSMALNIQTILLNYILNVTKLSLLSSGCSKGIETPAINPNVTKAFR